MAKDEISKKILTIQLLGKGREEARIAVYDKMNNDVCSLA